MTRRQNITVSESPVGKLERLIKQSIEIAKTAYRNRVNLSGDNYYANKLAELRADATNAYRELTPVTAGDSSALAELIEQVFASKVHRKARTEAARELMFSLRTTWRSSINVLREDDGLFPLSILSQAHRGYLVTIGRQMNGSFSQGWYDASLVMMRRLLEISVIEAFEAKGCSAKIKTSAGDYFQLSDLVKAALEEPKLSLSRNCKKALPILREAGHNCAHGRYYHARKEDVEALRPKCRIVIEELLHHAGLLS